VIHIRNYRSEDAPILVSLFAATVRQVGIKDYSNAQVEAWSNLAHSEDSFRKWAADGRTVLVAEAETGEPVAYGDLEPDGHIDHLYCHPDFVGKGVASAIYAKLESLALEQGIKELKVEASEAARRLFARKGFEVVARQDMDLAGTAIHNYRMSKLL
jgi:putative acetyltransferase